MPLRSQVKKGEVACTVGPIR